MRSLLIYGYGNPGRQDDGLGPALVTALEERNAANPRAGLVLESNYQLNAEDALEVSRHDSVIFVDAAEEGDAPFQFKPLLPESVIAFSTHSLSPGTVLALCGELYGKLPAAWILTIRGYSWEPNAPLSVEASANLDAALAFMQRLEPLPG